MGDKDVALLTDLLADLGAHALLTALTQLEAGCIRWTRQDEEHVTYAEKIAKAALAALPIPINYGTDTLMDPEDIANVIAFLVSPLAHGINGNVLFVDGGTDALLNSEKVY